MRGWMVLRRVEDYAAARARAHHRAVYWRGARAYDWEQFRNLQQTVGRVEQVKLHQGAAAALMGVGSVSP